MGGVGSGSGADGGVVLAAAVGLTLGPGAGAVGAVGVPEWDDAQAAAKTRRRHLRMAPHLGAAQRVLQSHGNRSV
ncbi:MAG: hypothetical protein ACJ79Y_05205, partial [Myxococcales bacterium]